MWPFKNYGILGQNARNLKYIGEYNDENSKRLADSKLKTKEFLSKKGVQTSESILVIKNHQELDDFDISGVELPFVIKPNAGYGGKGILIVDRLDEQGNFITNDNTSYSKDELYAHISDILDGFYSLSGSRDKAFFERKIVLDHSIDLLGKYGLPDIRVIVFNGVPVIAMLRVPTANSKGKANLHAGACGVGIDIGTGKLTNITQFSKIIKSIPGIGDVRGVELPHWDDVLKLVVKVQQITQIGYIGCDIVLDDAMGPILLEVNVRPGLEVQVANRIPLLDRLKKVEKLKISSVEKGVRLGKDLFGGDIEEKIKNISGKKVVGNKEYISFVIGDKTSKYITDINPQNNNNYINKDFLLQHLSYPESKIKQDFVKLKCNILGDFRSIKFIIKTEGKNISLGKEALYGFLVDPFKYKDGDLPYDVNNKIVKEKNIVILKGYEDQLLRLDKQIMEVDKKLNILKLITPKNVQTERLKFVQAEGKYIPKFEYNEIPFDLGELLTKIQKIEIPDIPLSQIYIHKKAEVITKIQFLQAFVKQNIKEMNRCSKLLYGTLKEDNLHYVKNILQQKPHEFIQEEFLSLDEIREVVEQFNHIYGLSLSLVEKETGARFSVKGDKLTVISRVKVGQRELRSIIAHEIEGHYLRKINGQKSKYSIFSMGTAGYIITEEGLAIHNQNRFLTKNDPKFYSMFERYHFLDIASKKGYQDLVESHLQYYDNNYSLVFNYLLRLKRGVRDMSQDYIFPKDVVYLNGYMEVKKYFEHGGKIQDLYYGKLSLGDIQILQTSEIINIKTDESKIPFFI